MKSTSDKTVVVDADNFRVLLDYNRWANDLAMDRSKKVGELDYHAIGDGLSFGDLHATLVHILVGELT